MLTSSPSISSLETNKFYHKQHDTVRAGVAPIRELKGEPDTASPASSERATVQDGTKLPVPLGIPPSDRTLPTASATSPGSATAPTQRPSGVGDEKTSASSKRQLLQRFTGHAKIPTTFHGIQRVLISLNACLSKNKPVKGSHHYFQLPDGTPVTLPRHPGDVSSDVHQNVTAAILKYLNSIDSLAASVQKTTIDTDSLPEHPGGYDGSQFTRFYCPLRKDDEVQVIGSEGEEPFKAKVIGLSEADGEISSVLVSLPSGAEAEYPPGQVRLQSARVPSFSEIPGCSNSSSITVRGVCVKRICAVTVNGMPLIKIVAPRLAYERLKEYCVGPLKSLPGGFEFYVPYLDAEVRVAVDASEESSASGADDQKHGPRTTIREEDESRSISPGEPLEQARLPDSVGIEGTEVPAEAITVSAHFGFLVGGEDGAYGTVLSQPDSPSIEVAFPADHRKYEEYCFGRSAKFSLYRFPKRYPSDIRAKRVMLAGNVASTLIGQTYVEVDGRCARVATQQKSGEEITTSLDCKASEVLTIFGDEPLLDGLSFDKPIIKTTRYAGRGYYAMKAEDHRVESFVWECGDLVGDIPPKRTPVSAATFPKSTTKASFNASLGGITVVPGNDALFFINGRPALSFEAAGKKFALMQVQGDSLTRTRLPFTICYDDMGDNWTTESGPPEMALLGDGLFDVLNMDALRLFTEEGSSPGKFVVDDLHKIKQLKDISEIFPGREILPTTYLQTTFSRVRRATSNLTRLETVESTKGLKRGVSLVVDGYKVRFLRRGDDPGTIVVAAKTGTPIRSMKVHYTRAKTKDGDIPIAEHHVAVSRQVVEVASSAQHPSAFDEGIALTELARLLLTGTR